MGGRSRCPTALSPDTGQWAAGSGQRAAGSGDASACPLTPFTRLTCTGNLHKPARYCCKFQTGDALQAWVHHFPHSDPGDAHETPSTTRPPPRGGSSGGRPPRPVGHDDPLPRLGGRLLLHEDQELARHVPALRPGRRLVDGRARRPDGSRLHGLGEGNRPGHTPRSALLEVAGARVPVRQAAQLCMRRDSGSVRQARGVGILPPGPEGTDTPPLRRPEQPTRRPRSADR